MMQTTFFWRYYEAPGPETSQVVEVVIAKRGLLAEAEVQVVEDVGTLLLVFFVWRQDHEEALEGDGEVFEGRRKPARLRLPPDTNKVHWHWGKHCYHQLNELLQRISLVGCQKRQTNDGSQ